MSQKHRPKAPITSTEFIMGLQVIQGLHRKCLANMQDLCLLGWDREAPEVKRAMDDLITDLEDMVFAAKKLRTMRRI